MAQVDTSPLGAREFISACVNFISRTPIFTSRAHLISRILRDTPSKKLYVALGGGGCTRPLSQQATSELGRQEKKGWGWSVDMEGCHGGSREVGEGVRSVGWERSRVTATFIIHPEGDEFYVVDGC